MSTIARKNVLTAVNAQRPEPSDELLLARIYHSQGGDLFMVEIPSGDELKTVLTAMPAKYMSLVWVKKGDLVMVELADPSPNAKVPFRIVYILTEEQLKHIVSKHLLPEVFMEEKYERYNKTDLKDINVSNRIMRANIDSDDELELPAHTNRQRRPFEDSSSSDDDDDDEE